MVIFDLNDAVRKNIYSMEASRLPDGPYLDELFDILQLRARDGTPYVQITIQCRGIMAQRNQDEVERLEIVAPYCFVRLKKQFS
jgi:hypothetical protein